jgi:putative GTP pyrophosphokinase
MNKLTEKYRLDLKSFDDYRSKVEALLRELLIQSGINFHKIESRIKDPIKLDEKIVRKNDKYNSLYDITDLVGLRVITFFEDEVDKVAKIIQSEFVVDGENSIDKRKLESDRFGYMSLHYIVSLKPERQALTEYRRFKEIKIEIQLRSILQHAWAEIEHDIGYKGELTIPDVLKRNFYRVAALLETADIEFVKIREEQNKYEASVGDVIKANPEEVEINSSSLRSYIDSSQDVKETDEQLVNSVNWTLREEIGHVESLVEKFYFVGVRSIKELDTFLKSNQKTVLEFCKRWARDRKEKGTVHRGISLFYLAYVLVGKTNDPEFAIRFYDKFIGKNHIKSRSGPAIVQIYNETVK